MLTIYILLHILLSEYTSNGIIDTSKQEDYNWIYKSL